MRIGLAFFALYAVAIFVLVTFYDRRGKDRSKNAGRGGDFES